MASVDSFPRFAPTPETAPFWEGVRNRVLRLPRCRTCNAYHFYPRPLCPYCWSRDLEWVTVGGRGRLHSFVINQRPPKHVGPGPIVLAMVELDEGPRLMTELVGIDPDPARLRCDMPVEVVFEAAGEGVVLPKFRPRGAR
ncbi:OB-fold domain-containing protein [Candidatus Binatia bacterium]|nr:OB-fold domain-containing protein [Candidatus Binatia bacterium]